MEPFGLEFKFDEGRILDELCGDFKWSCQRGRMHQGLGGKKLDLLQLQVLF